MRPRREASNISCHTNDVQLNNVQVVAPKPIQAPPRLQLALAVTNNQFNRIAEQVQTLTTTVQGMQQATTTQLVPDAPCHNRAQPPS